jgi:hypothetical protein
MTTSRDGSSTSAAPASPSALQRASTTEANAFSFAASEEDALFEERAVFVFGGARLAIEGFPGGNKR